MEAIETFKTKDGIVKIYQDTTPTDPREWDNLGIMVCFHNGYNLGDKTNLKSSDFNNWDELHDYINKELKAVAVLPLYLYDHSGITISTTPFNCRWDSGQIGFIYTTEEQIKKMCGDEKYTTKELEKKLLEEVKLYDKYLTGEVYGYNHVKYEKCEHCGHTEESILDSCWGFFDIKDIHEEFAKEKLIEIEMK